MNDPRAAPGRPEYLALAPGAGFLDACAAWLLQQAGPGVADWQVIIPNLLLAPAFKRALLQRIGGGLLLPSVETLPGLVAPRLADLGLVSDARRQFSLYQALRGRQWLEEGSLWAVCEELVALFDELSEADQALPAEEPALAALLQRGYGLGIQPEALRFEARLVHSLWLAEGAGGMSRCRARIAAAQAWVEQDRRPLLVIAEGPPTPLETRLWARAAQSRPVLVCHPERAMLPPGFALLNLAWPPEPAQRSLVERVRSGPAPASLAEVVGLVSAESLEHLAEEVVRRVCAWLAEGRREIVLVAVDRVAARRARALLERRQILVRDETGWKLSTTRAAALVDAWLEVCAADGYHRDVVDLFKSPFVFADLPPEQREAGVVQLEAGLVRENLVMGLDSLAATLAGSPDYPQAGAQLARLRQAHARMPRGSVPAAAWLDFLLASLDLLGATPALAADEAGVEVLGWLGGCREDLARESCRLSFSEWRNWLNRGFEGALFRDRSIDSPIVLTHLAATRLRRFDAALVIGADDRQLVAEARRPIFAHEGVRRELGLPGQEAARARLADDLAGLIAHAGQTVFLWQRLQGGEAGLPAAPIELLDLAHQAAGYPGLIQSAPVAADPAGGAGLPPPAPVIPPQARPARISPSAYATLVACPYAFFAQRVLKLGEAEEIREELAKADYGEMVHEVLRRFHQGLARVSDLPEEEALARLEAETEAVFAPAVGRNFLEQGWRMRWRARLVDYLAWQREREAQGWRFVQAELALERNLVAPDGSTLVLHGRIDRLDLGPAGQRAILDYKTRPLKPLNDLAADPEEGQLALYAALLGEAGEAAYVALDGAPVAQASLAEPAQAAQAHLTRLLQLHAEMGAGSPLPAHGVGLTCERCRLRGLCRKDYHRE
ncbi:MAG: PD-(D/E)XK nuclease family protein [Rhodocyclaceae bacterium]|jgi:ATP-dependent helicase/nuclease subunit B|nr:PD-(D/E)XK nuclease family protein [Rhodocyclaceae bacterium]